jgi:hypothetical protein
MPRTASRVDRAVFVDRYGRRRRAVIGTGFVLAAVLVAWLAVMCIGFAGVVQPGSDDQPGPDDRADIDSPH